MLARRGRQVICRSALEQFDVGHEAGAREQSLEQIVAQQRVVRNTSRQRLLEGIDVVDPLAGVRSLAEEILVHIRHSRRIRIYPGRPRRESLEHRARAAGERRGHARLEHGIPLHHPSRQRIDAWAVERMRHRPDQPLDGTERKPGIDVERHHVAHAARRDRSDPVLR